MPVNRIKIKLIVKYPEYPDLSLGEYTAIDFSESSFVIIHNGLWLVSKDHCEIISNKE